MVGDWQSAAEDLADLGPPLGYVGFSLGSIFGFPTVAAMPTIRAAAFVVGGLPTGPWLDDPVLSPVLLGAASGLGTRQVLMVNMTGDELFPVVGVHEIFDAIPGARKRLRFWPGRHDGWPDEAIEETAVFLKRFAIRSSVKRDRD
jgi:dienelactone hydrolase